MFVPVILCGGSGTRLWPESRKALPKQFLPLLGEKSFFGSTLKRLHNFNAEAKPLIITNEAMRFLVKDECEVQNISAHIILEPCARDTAAAVATAACLAGQKNEQAIVAILPSDHFITPDDLFCEDLTRACDAAKQGYITVFGILPHEPSSAYGYIETAESIADVEGLKSVVAFHEKPATEKAIEFIAQGRVWNSGLFIARADVLIEAFRKHAPDILNAASRAIQAGKQDGDFFRLDEMAFSSAPKKPFDIAVMEKISNAALLPARFTWSDIGAWDALWQVSQKDDRGNAISGNVVLHETTNSLIRSSAALTAVLGLDDVAVITTNDAILVAPKARMQEVKHLVAELEQQSRSEVAEHTVVRRPWGRYETKDLGARYRVKRITVKAGGRLSLQKHQHRSEHWVVVKGTATVTVEDQVFDLHENQSTYIPIGAIHRLENKGTEPLELVEVQVGGYLEEDDIVRLDDVYGRQ